jgi:hypothetical protein
MSSERRSSRAGADAAGNLLQVELLQERASNLGRLARRLERALKALADHDAQGVRLDRAGLQVSMITALETPSERGTLRAGEGHRDVAFNKTGAPRNPQGHNRDDERKRLLADAGEALFLYVVQREVLGLRGTAQALDELSVPREVRLCMAPRSVLLAR